MLTNPEKIIELITDAFAAVECPPDWCLRNSDEGDEPFLLEQEFADKTDWRGLDPEFLDQAPAGYATALYFFSNEAFRFYLPAYLIADIRGQLNRVNPIFRLTHGLDNSSRNERINPRRYGEMTWFDYARYKFSMFTHQQIEAIVAYLEWKKFNDAIDPPLHHRGIRQLLEWQTILMKTPIKKVLFVCAKNKIRSVTAEKMFAASQHYQVRSRGVGNDARVKLTAGDIGWADVIFVMEKNHKNLIAQKFREKIQGKRIITLFIEDIYEPMEEALILELRSKLAPYLVLP
ncbi:MAG: hypothetical protein LBV12_12405 [Puniceicoccales bacterium]|jgi:predicted protein tyrosine phosphatase|nr:hypothetical protein [Puniceicoccales bacterium]